MLHVLLGLASPELIAIIVVAAILLFGAERLPKLARNAARLKAEFQAGQAEPAQTESAASQK
jgi:TatA/E family protein of Tat protein translocase